MVGFPIIDGRLTLPTQPELWFYCKTEEEYFQILRERQKKSKPITEPIFYIPDSEPGIIPGGR